MKHDTKPMPQQAEKPAEASEIDPSTVWGPPDFGPQTRAIIQRTDPLDDRRRDN